MRSSEQCDISQFFLAPARVLHRVSISCIDIVWTVQLCNYLLSRMTRRGDDA